MKLGSVCLAFKEERFITPHLNHLQVDEKIVLNSTIPWNGEVTGKDETAKHAKLAGARVIRSHWLTEHDQRNTGQSLHEDKDWVIVLDPDEALLTEGWDKLKKFLETAEGDAYVCEKQLTYYKDGVIDPPEDYKQIIAVRPWVKFVDKRVVGTTYGTAPVTLHHFSWRRSDEEIWSKISHYAHANEFDKEKWFNEVWKTGRRENVHPLTPEALKRVIPVEVPEELNAWL